MNKAVLGAIGALLAATAACSIFLGGPAYTPVPTPAGTEPTQSLQDQLAQALVQGTETGQITLKISEDQLTTYLATKLAEQPNPILTDPRVVLQAGQMKIYGRAQTGIFAANVSMAVSASVDANGQPQIKVLQTDFGPIKAPQGLNDALGNAVQQAFTGSLGPVATGFRLEDISVGDGELMVTGRFK